MIIQAFAFLVSLSDKLHQSFASRIVPLIFSKKNIDILQFCFSEVNMSLTHFQFHGKKKELHDLPHEIIEEFNINPLLSRRRKELYRKVIKL